MNLTLIIRLSENKAADGLSCIVDHHPGSSTALLMALTVPTMLQLQDLYREIDGNTEIQEVLIKLGDGETVKEGYYVVEGRLFDRKSLVIPTASVHIPLILQECHDSVLGGHFGVLKTMKRIQAVFYWTKMRQMKCILRM